MPVTAKLSRRFYEQLGDDVAGELVDWFNSVDAEYQRQFRETNDLNWERFKAFVDARIAELRRDMEVLVAAEVKGLRSDFASLRSDLMKWMFIYWTGSIVTLGGLVLTVLYNR